jgi:NTP pyrophosphatase (non-canonical NTP hydrolase)
MRDLHRMIAEWWRRVEESEAVEEELAQLAARVLARARERWRKG